MTILLSFVAFVAGLLGLLAVATVVRIAVELISTAILFVVDRFTFATVATVSSFLFSFLR